MKLWITLIILILLLPVVTGLGVAPAEIEFTHEANLETSMSLIIINNEAEEKTVSISSDSNQISIENSVIEFENGETEKTVFARIKMPETLEPGPHVLKIFVKENPERNSQITATVTVVSKVTLFSPYPDKYLRTRIAKTIFEQDKEGIFVIEAESLGLLDIEKAVTEVIILDQGKRLVKLESETKSIPSLESVFFNLPWIPDVRPGSYRVEAITSFDRNKVEAAETFFVGKQELDVISAKAFGTGNIRIELQVMNNWNSPLKEGWAELIIEQDGETYGTSPTVIQSFEKYETRQMDAYWNPRTAPYGNYDLVVKLHYLDKIKEVVLKATYNENGLFVEGETVDITEKEFRKPGWLFYIVVVLLVIALSYEFMHYSKKY